jgi:hypothetical protein
VGGGARPVASAGLPSPDGKLRAIPWLIRGSTCEKNASDTATGFLKFIAYQCRHENKKRGGVVNTQNSGYPKNQGFSIQDILWAVGIWSVILSLSPVVLFYVLMVN